MELTEYLISETANPISDWDTKSEKQQLAFVRISGLNIEKISHPSEAVQLAAVKQDGWLIQLIENPKPDTIKAALTQQDFINDSRRYESTIKEVFKDNTILVKKWIRYGETMRDENRDPATVVF